MKNAQLITIIGIVGLAMVGTERAETKNPQTLVTKTTLESPCSCDDCECRADLIERIEELELQVREYETSVQSEPESNYQLYVFTADWCGPCRTHKAGIDKAGLSHDYEGNSDVWYVDADKFPATLKQYGVTALPTSILIDKSTGRVVRQAVGPVDVLSKFPELD